MERPSVDFVVNCYERTYREVLAPGFVTGLVAQQLFEFADVTVLVNNVGDRALATELAEQLVARGEATRYAFVDDHLDAALATTGLSRRRIRRLPHFTDCCLVAVCLDGPDWVAYWDADATLQEPHDWITPTIAAMEHRPLTAIGNPNNWHEGLAVKEAATVEGDVAIGYGFSDVAFLGRRSDLAAPIYRKWAPSAWRYPLAAVEPIFEQRVDAWMRRCGRTRVTYLPAVVTHPASVGANYPAAGLRERVRGRLQRMGSAAAARVDHPATRPWPDPSRMEERQPGQAAG